MQNHLRVSSRLNLSSGPSDNPGWADAPCGMSTPMPESGRPRPRAGSLTLKHCVLFCALFLAGTGLHYLTRPYLGPLINRLLNAEVAAWVIAFCSPSEGVHASGSTVGGANTYVQVAQGCEGIDVMLMLVAAIVAFPMTARRKLVGAIAGTLLIYALNVSRIVGLWYCLRFWPSNFDTMHLIVGQTILIFAGVIYFAALTRTLGGGLAEPS